MLGSLVSAGAGLIGGFLNSNSTKKANEQNAALARENIAQQREFAQQGLTWKIDDAFRNADRVHPIYSMGSTGPTFSPVSANFAADTGVGSAIASAGQDIGRAVNATATGKQRTDAFTVASQKLAIEKGTLENELLRTELASKNGRLRQVSAPPFPGDNYLIPGQPSSGIVDAVKDKALERIRGHPDAKHMEPGAITDVGHARTSGGLFPVPGDDTKQRIEDNFYQETMHFLRNNLLPMISPVFNDPPKVKLKEGHTWVYDPVYGYKQVRDTRTNRFFRNNIN